MFTSRAEHRLLLGCDSVYERLSPVAERLGILDDERKRRIEARTTRMQEALKLGELELRPDKETNAWRTPRSPRSPSSRTRCAR
jgi:tRNA uridine 5-carboxymethylaminomethyl modification enzyme